MAQEVELTSKTNDPSLIPGPTWWREPTPTNSYKLSSDLSMCIMAHLHSHTSAYKIIKRKKSGRQSTDFENYRSNLKQNKQ